MIPARMLGSQQQKNQIHRLPIEGIEVDRFVEAREQANDALERSELDVRDGNAAAEPCRAQSFALQQRVKDFARGQSRQLRGTVAQLLKRLLLALGLEGRNDAFGRQ